MYFGIYVRPIVTTCTLPEVLKSRIGTYMNQKHVSHIEIEIIFAPP